MILWYWYYDDIIWMILLRFCQKLNRIKKSNLIFGKLLFCTIFNSWKNAHILKYYILRVNTFIYCTQAHGAKPFFKLLFYWV